MLALSTISDLIELSRSATSGERGSVVEITLAARSELVIPWLTPAMLDRRRSEMIMPAGSSEPGGRLIRRPVDRRSNRVCSSDWILRRFLCASTLGMLVLIRGHGNPP